jgi:hypothetical protein
MDDFRKARQVENALCEQGIAAAETALEEAKQDQRRK